MDAAQLLLPCFEMREVCPLCLRPARILGQYSPLWPHGVCRDCSLAEPYPIQVFEPSPTTKDRSGLRIKLDSDYKMRERRVALDNLIRDAVKGKVTEEEITKFNITLRELRNPLRHGKTRQYASWLKSARLSSTYQQQEFPVCGDCGNVHDHRYKHIDGIQPYCQACSDQRQLDTLWRNKWCLFTEDIEEQLDKLFKSWPELFERGILPDGWFKLVEATQAVA